MSYYLSGSPSDSNDTKVECNITNIHEDIHNYNTFYVYGLTSLNLLFIIIIIVMIFSIIKDSEKINKRQTKSNFEID